MLRFLCCTDTHGETPPAADEAGATAWMHAGDMFNAGLLSRAATQIRRLEMWAARRSIPAYSVQGNHDCGRAGECLRKFSHDVAGKAIAVAPGLFVVGIGWCGTKFFDVPEEDELKEVCKKAAIRAKFQMNENDRCILLTHYPPRMELLDPNDGKGNYTYECVRDVINELEPLAVIYGHIHEFSDTKFGHQTKRGRTLVVNPGKYGGELFVDLEKNSVTYQHRLTKRIGALT